MGCQMLAILDAPVPRARPKLAHVPEWFESWEQSLSRFRESSELSQLNRSPGVPVEVSQTLWSVLQAALRAEEQSGGLVTPAVLEALERAGYDRSFDTLERRGERQNGTLVAEAAPAIALSQVKFEPESRRVRLPVGLRLDFGGVAKGWAAQQAMQHLSPYGPVLVDAGGDIAISGLQADGSPWVIGVADPMEPDSDLATLSVGKCGVATSGTDYRRWKKDGAWQHHIIDPRTGLPATSDVLSATVVAPNVMDAEVAAKTALILGSLDGLGWLEAHPAYAGLLVLGDGQRLISSRIEAYLD
jgi:thiamine biosynthesis lipoprotein